MPTRYVPLLSVGFGVGALYVDPDTGTVYIKTGEPEVYSALNPSSTAALTALAALTPAANKLPYFTNGTTAALADLSAFARTLIDDANAAAALATLGAQASSTLLDALIGAGSIAANKMLYGTGADTYAQTDLTAGARTLLGKSDANLACFAFFDAAPANGTVCICLRSPIAGTVSGATVKTDSGTVTCDFKIGSTSITSLDAVAASSSKGTTSATGANTVAVGDEINLTYSSASSPVNFRCTVNLTR